MQASKLLKQAFLTTALAVSSILPMRGQERLAPVNNASVSFPLSHNLAEKEILIPVTCTHSDQETPYNEFNPGIMVISHYPTGAASVNGFYKNSNYGISPLTATIAEQKVSFGANNDWQLRYGVVIGFAGYSRKRHNTFEIARCNEVGPFDELPQPQKTRRGQMVGHFRDSAGVCYQTISTRQPRGAGMVLPRVVVFPTVSVLYRDNGVFLIGAVAPYLGPNKGWGGMVGGGMRLNPFSLLQQFRGVPAQPAPTPDGIQ